MCSCNSKTKERGVQDAISSSIGSNSIDHEKSESMADSLRDQIGGALVEPGQSVDVDAVGNELYKTCIRAHLLRAWLEIFGDLGLPHAVG